MAGLAISYALSVSTQISILLNCFVETEKELISVERIDDYATNALLESNYGSALVRFLEVYLVFQAKMILFF